MPVYIRPEAGASDGDDKRAKADENDPAQDGAAMESLGLPRLPVPVALGRVLFGLPPAGMR